MTPGLEGKADIDLDITAVLGLAPYELTADLFDWLIVVLLILNSESSLTVGNSWLTLHDVDDDIWMSGDVTEGGLLLVFSVIPKIRT